MRRIGLRLSIHAFVPVSSSASRIISLMKKPGLMALTRTPRSAHSPASWRVSWITAALDAWYAGLANSVPPMPQIEAMLMIDPDCRSSMWRPTSRA